MLISFQKRKKPGLLNSVAAKRSKNLEISSESDDYRYDIYFQAALCLVLTFNFYFSDDEKTDDSIESEDDTELQKAKKSIERLRAKSKLTSTHKTISILTPEISI